MKLVILNARNRFREQDLKRLDKYKPVFYEEKDKNLESIKEFKSNEGVVFAVQPGWIKGSWEGLPWEIIKDLKNLKGLCLSTTAYGWVPFKELGKIGIPVTNVPGKSTDAVAEYYVFLMIALLRKLPGVIKNNWKFTYGPDVLGTDAKGLTAGIVGLGKIGSKIAKICQGYEMNITYWSRSKKKTTYQRLELDDLCRTADVVFLTTLADNSTKGLITRDKIDLMKSTAIILSPIEKTVYDQKYVLEKIANGQLGGLGFESEDKTPLSYEGNVFPAPEIGYYTKQTLDNESRIMTDSIVSIFEGKPVNVVNL
ncbi:MAG: D-isomer specific 2-hydroxyacid dehydrogenase NAD-binding protein [Microgenomates group bacterium GW2011_GWA1_48_10]|uniref:D-isomer specific 2-hydroxyacid dehydrogenase NAD-binding domain-containing protein n=1 Tax=Candidatus Gottesmanbacteria bacterium RIFCSPHIGHO2_01_FULL_47_48 TaxID=1798381 RepID=A0A1F5ZZD9_9BACT|nr:MAG: D-isomer specific 2-hydroxyacid dehydrogenase NAD-binding protein [Microgenomates group bacterium GW2011_GWA1_48_10]OGG17715.1 MAG: hypothetical protein A2721_00540 [Candidatus Gottesmanbacteria bacterium RIFCSPHIGHO2_01_FULL_47_48]